MYKQLALAGALLAFGATAQAAPEGSLDLFFVPSAKFDVTIPGLGSGSDDGDGMGIKGMAPIGDGSVVTGEYQSNSYDETGIDVDGLRFGLGFVGNTGSGVFGEYVTIDLDGSDADGFGLHARLSGGSRAAKFYGQVGYLMLSDDEEDIQGLEFLVGGAIPFSGSLAGLVEYRKSTLEGKDSEIEYEFSDLRVGIRFRF